MGMVGSAVQYDLLSGLAEQKSSMSPSELEKLEKFVALTAEHNGLILQAVIPELLQVSRQRWHVLRKKYEFQSWEFFGHRWFSRKQIEDFSKLDRSSGRGRPSLSRILDETKKELLQ